ncbi:MAG: hypothetical protein ACJ71W_21835 [Terriglobales bacterium]
MTVATQIERRRAQPAPPAPERTISGKTCTLPDDQVRIVRMLPAWKNQAIWFAVGRCGMCYLPDGRRAFLLDFGIPGVAGEACRDFAFDTLDEIESFLGWLPLLREIKTLITATEQEERAYHG